MKSAYDDPPELDDYAFEMLRNLREMLDAEHGLQTIIMKAYADFERLGTPSQGPLYLMGIDTHNVLGTEHKNAADMRLCIDAMEVLYTRPEISTFVFVAGDRDYIPVIQHLKRQARGVLASAFRENVSGDLLENIGKNRFIDALTLLSDETRIKLGRRKEELESKKQKSALIREKGLPAFHRLFGNQTETNYGLQQLHTVQNLQNGLVPEAAEEIAAIKTEVSDIDEKIAAAAADSLFNKPITSGKPYQGSFPKFEDEEKEEEQSFEGITHIDNPDQLRCLEFILENIGKRHELWMGPFLRQINGLFPLLADWERKLVLERLRQAGAIRIEKRQGDPYDFTVLLVNYNHPEVRRLNRG